MRRRRPETVVRHIPLSDPTILPDRRIEDSARIYVGFHFQRNIFPFVSHIDDDDNVSKKGRGRKLF